MTVLVLRRGGFGDTLLTLPLLRALRRAHPGTAIALAGVRGYGEVLRHYGAVDEALSSEALELWAPARAMPRLQRFARVIGDEPAICSEVLVPQRVRTGVPFGVQLATQVGLAPEMPGDGWLLPPRRRDDGPVVLAPGSGGRAKCWSAERWLELAAGVDGELAVVVGPTEQERDDPQRWPWPRPVQFVVDLSPVQLAEALAGARAFVGNDSGTTHLAAALGVPTVAIFGPTDPAVWAPVGRHVGIVRAPHANLQLLGADCVAAALAEAGRDVPKGR